MTFWFDTTMDDSGTEPLQGLETLKAQVRRDMGVIGAAGRSDPEAQTEAPEQVLVVMPGIYAADTQWAVVPCRRERPASNRASRKAGRKRWSVEAIREVLASLLA